MTNKGVSLKLICDVPVGPGVRESGIPLQIFMLRPLISARALSMGECSLDLKEFHLCNVSPVEGSVGTMIECLNKAPIIPNRDPCLGDGFANGGGGWG